MDQLLTYLSGLDTISFAVLVAGVLFAIYILPNIVKRLGIVKLGPLEMEHKHQTQNYEINRKIEDIDITNRENLWDMTEDMFSMAAESSPIKCEAIVGYILAGVSSPIRNLVLINHIAPKLVKSYESQLRVKIMRGISRAIKDARVINHDNGCPVMSDIQALTPERYDQLIDNWIIRAREITSRACLDKIRLYESAIENTNDKYWKDVYKTCVQKNKAYVKGMGYDVL